MGKAEVNVESRWRVLKPSFVALFVTMLLSSAVAVVAVVVPPPSSVSAATIAFGNIQAQMADHRGVNSGTTGNCITYSPVGSATSTTYVVSPNQAITAHGYSGSSCPSTLSTTSQSAIGFSPFTQTSVDDGVPFLIGRMVHYNNPITANDRYFTGNLNIRLTSFASTTIAFPWTLDETPNTGPNTNDELAFNNQISDVTLVQGGLTFRMVVNGFIPVATATTCPASPGSATPQNVFSTVEGTQTHACLYATLVQARTLTIVKATVGTPTGSAPPVRSFAFTSSSTLAGSPWTNGSFSLAGGANRTAALTSGNTVGVTETDPGDDRWVLTGLACTELAANGTAQPMRNATINVSRARSP